MTRIFYTVEEISERVESLTNRGTPLDPSQIRRIARDLGIGQKIGRDWLFTAADLKAIRKRRGPGRPPASTKPQQRKQTRASK